MKILNLFTLEYCWILQSVLIGLVFGAVILNTANGESSGSAAEIVAGLDTEYQTAVERNDADTMDRILADDFVLVVGNGTVYTKPDLIQDARSEKTHYEKQVEIDNSQKVRVWGDTAVVTAKLWIKGTREGQAFERKLWFSDTYVRTKNGWKYVFGQASLALPKEQ
jgi:ketosteroid isomerase-like protein